MIKKTMKVRENTFRKLEDPFENGAAKKYVFYVKVDDVAEGIPMATNPRDQKLTSGVATAIKESLLSNDGYFHLKNRGIVLSAESVHYNNKEKIATIIFSDELSHGNIDGGHTYKIVCEHKGENLEQYVQFEVMTGVEDIIENLAEARNTSVQVDAKSMAELAEKFDPIKEGLEGMPFFKRIAFKQKYYEVFYILFHTGLRISEFCGLTIKDIDLKNRIINIDHQLQRIGSMEYHIESTKTNAGTRKLPMTEDVFRMFRAILEDRPTDFPEIMVDGYVGFLFRDKNGMPEVALHWEHRLKNAVNRYNSIFRVQLPKITPHICRHTYCSNQAKAGMNPKTLQYLMGHSDIGVTMNTYTHLSLDDAKNEMIRMEELEQARKEVDKAEDKKPMKQNMFKVV